MRKLKLDEQRKGLGEWAEVDQNKLGHTYLEKIL